MKNLAKFISIILHPLIIPTLGVLIILYSGLDFTLLTYEQKRGVLLVIFLSTYVIPLSFMPFFMLRKAGFTIYMETTRERLMPFFLTSAVYFIAFYFLRKIGIPAFILNYIFASAIAVLLTTIVTNFWKISIHLVGIGGITGLLFFMAIHFNYDVFLFSTLSFLLAGFIGSSRLTLNVHSLSQVFAGYALGVFTVLITLSLLV
jgi:membrane-associated phospholipid phosphatase